MVPLDGHFFASLYSNNICNTFLRQLFRVCSYFSPWALLSLLLKMFSRWTFLGLSLHNSAIESMVVSSKKDSLNRTSWSTPFVNTSDHCLCKCPLSFMPHMRPFQRMPLSASSVAGVRGNYGRRASIFRAFALKEMMEGVCKRMTGLQLLKFFSTAHLFCDSK